MKISEKLIILRKRFGFSQEALANELDVSRQSVYKWENDSATPDISKIKRLAKLFDVSYDILLDDDVNITDKPTINETREQPPKPTERKFRRFFDSKVSFSSDQPSLDNGYLSTRKRKNRDSGAILFNKKNRMKKTLNAYGVTETIPLAPDVAACLFINNNNMTFGFYYNESIQFICPYENFISAQLTNSGAQLTYKKQSVFGFGFGQEGINSVGVGSIPVAQLNTPYTYYLKISYFDSYGAMKEYKLTINTLRVYPIYEYKKIDMAEMSIKLIAEETAKQMTLVQSRLASIPTITQSLSSKLPEIDEIDIETIKELYEVTSNQAKIYLNSLCESTEKDNKQAKIDKLIIIGLIAGLVGIFFIFKAFCG